jgi:hypothetical protein
MLQWFHADRLVTANLPASRLRVQDHLKAALMGIELTAILVRVGWVVKSNYTCVIPIKVV